MFVWFYKLSILLQIEYFSITFASYKLLILNQISFIKIILIDFQVFVFLLKMYLNPPDPSFLGVISLYKNTFDRSTQPDIPAALRLLEVHASKIDTVKVSTPSICISLSSYIKAV